MINHPGITLLGLGPGGAGQLTREAWDWIGSLTEIVLRTRNHPAVDGFPAGLRVHVLEEAFGDGDSAEAVFSGMVERVLELGRRPQGVTYAVPGHPYVGEATGPEIARRAREAGIPLRVIEGLSFVGAVSAALGVDVLPHTMVVDALHLSRLLTPDFPPDQPVLIAQVHSRQAAAALRATLGTVYPEDHHVRLVHAAGTPHAMVEELTLGEIERSRHLGAFTSLYLPPLGEHTSLESFQQVVARLRAPDGCPWDRKQDHQTLRKHLMGEMYEALDAMDRNDAAGMCEEFGDVLLQIVLNAQIGMEYGEFSMADILRGINQKIIRRHPHVFGDVQLDGVEGVLQNWEKLKAEERKANGESETKGLLDGVPLSLPALAQAQEVQMRAKRVGFDWDAIEPVIAKVIEELDEVRSAPDEKSRAGELGDLLFAVVNVVRWYDVDAEAALRETTRRFRRRFGYIEAAARTQGRGLADLSFAEMDALWEQAKEEE